MLELFRTLLNKWVSKMVSAVLDNEGAKPCCFFPDSCAAIAPRAYTDPSLAQRALGYVGADFGKL